MEITEGNQDKYEQTVELSFQDYVVYREDLDIDLTSLFSQGINILVHGYICQQILSETQMDP